MKRLMLALALISFPCVATASDVFFDEVVEADAVTEFNAEEVIAHQQAQQDLWNHLQSSRVDGERAQIRLALGDLDKALLDNSGDGATQGRLLGLHIPVGHSIDLSREAEFGKVSSVGRELVWNTSIHSGDATALRIHFTNVDLPKGAALYVYNDAGQAHGPYTGKGPNDTGDFWSHTVFGDHAWVQVHHAGQGLRGLGSVGFEIADVSHLGDRFEVAKRANPAKADCSANLHCVENAECYNWSVLDLARKAVGLMVYEDGGSTLGCTGGLLNDQDTSHQIPWFLTAHHCIDNEDVADTLETFFQFQANCGSCSYFGNAPYSVLGADVWATGQSQDFTLLELSGLPSSRALMGWTNAQVLDDVGTQLYRISHPQAQPQAVTQVEVLSTSGTDYIISDIVLGTTEGISSGAPIFRSDRKVVGQYRGISYPDGDTLDRCDASTFNAKDGALSTYWRSVKAYLAPTKTSEMHVSDVTAGTRSFLSGLFYFGKSTVTVVDPLGNVVPRATVTVTFSNGLNGSYTGITDDEGKAVILHMALNSKKPSFTACVSQVTHDYFNTYDSAANDVTCASR